MADNKTSSAKTYKPELIMNTQPYLAINHLALIQTVASALGFFN